MYDQSLVVYEDENINPDKDFAFEYTLLDPNFGVGLITHRENVDEDGYFMLFISPRYEEQTPDIVPKDFTFVLDRSERMAGEKIRRAKEVLHYCINNLTNRDRFNILAFNSDIISLNKIGEFLDVRRNRRKPLDFIEDIQAAGSADTSTALLTALSGSQTSNRPCIIVLLTDGQPTINVAKASRILKNIAEANAKQARIFVFGIGDDLNIRFLDRLAAYNGGTYHYLDPNEDIEEAVSSLFRQINDPGITNIDIDFGDIATEDVYPQDLPDLSSHKQLTLVGRYKRHGRTRLEIRGHINGEMHNFIKDVHFNEIQSRYNFLPRLWAEWKIKDLMEESESYKEIMQLRDVHRIPQTFQRPSAELKRERIFLPQWYQWCLENVKYLGRKTFYQHEHIWVDGEYDGVSETKKIVIGSPEYCDLINSVPDLVRLLRQHEEYKEMILYHNGVSYQIVPDEV